MFPWFPVVGLASRDIVVFAGYGPQEPEFTLLGFRIRESAQEKKMQFCKNSFWYKPVPI
jgi:hypothetical protein